MAATMRLSATPLEAHLSRSRSPGHPLHAVVAAGVAAFCPRDMQARGVCVADIVKVTSRAGVVVVRAWGVSGLATGVLLLDRGSLSVIGGGGAISGPRSDERGGHGDSAERRESGGRKERTGRRESGGRRRLRESVGAGEGVCGADDVVEVEIEVVDMVGDVRDAKVVGVAIAGSGADTFMEGGEEYMTLVHRVLLSRVLIAGMIVPISLMGVTVRVEVRGVDLGGGALASDGLGRVTKHTVLQAWGPLSQGEAIVDAPNLLDGIGGLEAQVTSVLEIARVALREDEDAKSAKRSVRKPRGVLLHGAPGTGKTLIASAVAQACGASLEVVCGPEIVGEFSGQSERALEAVFMRAERRAPCVVVLDEVDAIAPKRDAVGTENAEKKLTATLLALLDGHDATKLNRVFVVGTTNRQDDIDPAMRRPGRFDREVEIPVPSSAARLDILNRLSRKARDAGRFEVSDEDFAHIATVAYGFVGADLAALWRESANHALKRHRTQSSITAFDLRAALRVIKPSALREVAVEIPSVRWDDVGGKDSVKQRLRESVEWPLTTEGAALFNSIGVSPPRGILLFGPPGCSKTLLAKAVATESGANFISIKGPELLSKWVGESEKAVRAMFRRARQAAPCVIFFDEIDALATSRSHTVGASAQARVVAQLLTEMDGIDSCSSLDAQSRVVVIAATNRPDLLDEALLRPGRMDIQIHVGLPDAAERLAILRVHTRRVPVHDAVNIEALAGDDQTGGMSGAELAAVVREAALAAMEEDVENASSVSRSNFEAALKRVRPRTPADTLAYFDNYLSQLTKQSCTIR